MFTLSHKCCLIPLFSVLKPKLAWSQWHQVNHDASWWLCVPSPPHLSAGRVNRPECFLLAAIPAWERHKPAASGARWQQQLQVYLKCLLPSQQLSRASPAALRAARPHFCCSNKPGGTGGRTCLDKSFLGANVWGPRNVFGLSFESQEIVLRFISSLAHL